MITLNKSKEAQEVLKTVISKTDLVAAANWIENIYLKLENTQKTGSFKVRGAFYKLSRLTTEEKEQGIVAASAGNHAQGVALAAQALAIQSCIFMPESAPSIKVQATRKYNSDVQLVGNTFNESYNEAKKYCSQNKSTFIEPFDDIDVIIGQSTIALEILEQLPDVEQIVLPIGGGGLAAGVSSIIKQVKPNCSIIGVEEQTHSSMNESIVNNRLTTKFSYKQTLADGLAVKTPGALTFDICKNNIDRFIQVTEEQIIDAIKFTYNKLNQVVEGAAATTIAAVLSGQIDTTKKTVLILSGSNIEKTKFEEIINQI